MNNYNTFINPEGDANPKRSSSSTPSSNPVAFGIDPYLQSNGFGNFFGFQQAQNNTQGGTIGIAGGLGGGQGSHFAIGANGTPLNSQHPSSNDDSQQMVDQDMVDNNFGGSDIGNGHRFPRGDQRKKKGKKSVLRAEAQSLQQDLSQHGDRIYPSAADGDTNAQRRPRRNQRPSRPTKEDRTRMAMQKESVNGYKSELKENRTREPEIDFSDLNQKLPPLQDADAGYDSMKMEVADLNRDIAQFDDQFEDLNRMDIHESGENGELSVNAQRRRTKIERGQYTEGQLQAKRARLAARAAKRAELKAMGHSKKALMAAERATKDERRKRSKEAQIKRRDENPYPATSILGEHICSSKGGDGQFDLDRMRDFLAREAATYRSICENLPEDDENEGQHQKKRIFCYFEVLFNKRDGWTEDEVHAEVENVNRWEKKGLKDYDPDWRDRNLRTAAFSQELMNKRLTPEERQAMKDAARQKMVQEKDMMGLLGAFGV